MIPTVSAALALCFLVPAIASAQAPTAAPLGSRIIDWNSLAATPTKTGEKRTVFDAPTATLTAFECHITTLNPGESPHPPHHHPDEELIVLKEGTLEVTINGKTARVGPGSILFFSSNDVHGFKNIGTTRATYHVFRFSTPLTPKATPTPP